MLLALDTSTPVTVLALAEDRSLVASLRVRVPGRLEEGLLPAITRFLEAAGRDRAALDTLAVGLGPGGYTSLRIGIATVKGMAVGLETRLVGVGSLRVLARGVGSAHAVGVAFGDARRGEVYGSAYAVSGPSRELVAPVHGTIADVAQHVRERLGGAPCVAVGDAFTAYPELFPLLGASAVRGALLMDTPTPEALLLEAWDAIDRGDFAPLDGLEPHYVKPSDAKLPLRPLRTSLGPDTEP